MLATLDDISNLNLNNLAGSALGLWDHARAFLLSFLVFSLSLPHFPSFPLSVPLSRSLSLTSSPVLSPLFLVSSISLLYVPRYLTLTHDCIGGSWLIKSLVPTVSSVVDEEAQIGEYLDTDRLLILNWCNIYNIARCRRPSQISPGDQSYGAAVILKNIEPSKCLHVLCLLLLLPFFLPYTLSLRNSFALWPKQSLIKVYPPRVGKYVV